MRRSTQRKLNNLGLASIVLGCVVLSAFGLKTLMDTNTETATGGEAFIPYETSTVPEATDTPTPTPTPTATNQELSDGEHKVKITAESDGAIRIGFKFTGGDEGFEDANRTFSITRTVRGSTALAQVGVQVGQNATYAKCTISVDGAQKSTQRTSGKVSVAVCGV